MRVRLRYSCVKTGLRSRGCSLVSAGTPQVEEYPMNLNHAVLLCGMALTTTIGRSQPEIQLNASALAPAPPDLAIVRALETIQPSRIEETINSLVRFSTRSTLSSLLPNSENGLPPGQGINAAGDWIAAQFEQISKECGGCLDVRRDSFIQPAGERIPQPTPITNIYAILRGTDPSQTRRKFLVTGHYDSRNTDVMDARGASPGANDDASGVAVSLECARALSKLRFPASIVFVAVAGEEQGLYGSEHLAKLARSEGWQLEAVLNNDIVGGNTTPGDPLQQKDRVRVFSEGLPVAATPEELRRIRALGEEEDSPSRQLARAVADTAHTYFPASRPSKFAAHLVFRPDRYLRGGDHISFNREGFAAVRFTEWREDFNHQHQNVVRPPEGSESPVLGDLPQFVDFHYVANVARLNAAALATLASAPGEPAKVTLRTDQLENATTLRWEPPAFDATANAKVDHYEVLWRETTAPDWQFVQNVKPASNGAAGTSLTVTMPVSKDNVIFGVRAVDAAGHRSLAVVPE